jgi:hypothetical protein
MRVERKQWAVALRNSRIEEYYLLWEGWHEVARLRPQYDGEATTPLLFATKRHAAAFAREQNRQRQAWDRLQGGHFAVVRARLIVEPIV